MSVIHAVLNRIPVLKKICVSASGGATTYDLWNLRKSSLNSSDNQSIGRRLSGAVSMEKRTFVNMLPCFSGIRSGGRQPSGHHWFSPPTHRTPSTPNAPKPAQDAPKIFKTDPKKLWQDPKTAWELPKNAGRAQNVPKDPPGKRNWSPHPLGTARLAAFFVCWR